MVNQAKNNHELRQMLTTPLKLAVRILMEKILEVNDDTIKRVVYNAPGRPLLPGSYQSTTEFLNAWDIAVHSSKAIKTSDIQGSFFYKPSEMNAVPPCAENNHMGQHHGIGQSGDSFYGDSRDYLADIIYQGLAGPAYGDGYWRKKRDAFNELVKIVGRRNFNKWFLEAMQDVGLNVKSHGGIVRKDTK